MLPPMAIFFPLFTLLEDFGYLPRVAFNLDNIFKKSGTHGKQSLSMMMGFGCNAAGVAAMWVIHSPREMLDRDSLPTTSPSVMAVGRRRFGGDPLYRTPNQSSAGSISALAVVGFRNVGRVAELCGFVGAFYAQCCVARHPPLV